MILLQEFRVSADGLKLIVDVKANEDTLITDNYIKEIKVSTDSTFTDTFATTIFPTALQEAGFDLTLKVKRVRVIVDIMGINTPFFLYVKAGGTTTVCYFKDTLSGVTFNKYPIYKTIACAAHQLGGCEIPLKFIDYLMKLKALEASIAVGDDLAVIQYYNWLIKHIGNTQTTISTIPLNQSCNCNR